MGPSRFGIICGIAALSFSQISVAAPATITTLSTGAPRKGPANKTCTAQAPVIPIVPAGNLLLVQPFLTPTSVINGCTFHWSEMTEQQKKNALTLEDTAIQVEQRNVNGSVSHAIGSISIGKGEYLVTFLYMRYENMLCNPAAPSAGIVRVGVGLQTALQVHSDKKDVSVGSLLPITFEAHDKNVRGVMEIQTVGITSDSKALAGYLGNNLQLTPESLEQAMQSMAIIRAVLENDQTLTTPHILAVSESKPGACSNVVPPKTLLSNSALTVSNQ